jgi:predicted transglutaminase-like cysteine proteinase
MWGYLPLDFNRRLDHLICQMRHGDNTQCVDRQQASHARLKMSSPAGHGPRIAALVLCCGLCHLVAATEEDDHSLALESVNIAVNHRIVFADDLDNWGQLDYWATPDELYERGSGDCEDYAIAKYFALLAAGLPAKQLRLIYVQVLAGGSGDIWRPHVAVAYLPAVGEDRILDTLLDEIRPLSRRPDLRVLISFDTDGIWRGLERGEPARDARRIKPWAQVLARMAASHERAGN